MLTVSSMSGFGSKTASPFVEASFTERGSLTTTATSYTISGVALGAAATDRKIIVGISLQGYGGVIVGSMTIGGVSASRISGAVAIAVNGSGTEIYEADVPSGTTGDIVIGTSTTNQSLGYAVHRLVGSAASEDDVLVSVAEPSTGTIDCPAGGVIIGYAWNEGSDATVVWTGITEDFDDLVTGSSVYSHTSAFGMFSDAQSGRTITADWTTDTADAMVVCSFGPA